MYGHAVYCSSHANISPSQRECGSLRGPVSLVHMAYVDALVLHRRVRIHTGISELGSSRVYAWLRVGSRFACWKSHEEAMSVVFFLGESRCVRQRRAMAALMARDLADETRIEASVTLGEL